MRSFELSQTLEEKQCLRDICGLLGVLLWWDSVEDPTGSRWVFVTRLSPFGSPDFIFGVEK